jgi:hypothetical protein
MSLWPSNFINSYNSIKLTTTCTAMDFLKKGLEAAKKAGNKAVNQIKEVRTLSAARCPPASRACLWRASTHSTPPLSAAWPHAAARAGLGGWGSRSGH